MSRAIEILQWHCLIVLKTKWARLIQLNNFSKAVLLQNTWAAKVDALFNMDTFGTILVGLIFWQKPFVQINSNMMTKIIDGNHNQHLCQWIISGPIMHQNCDQIHRCDCLWSS